MKKSLKERFWEKVDRRGPDECWPWTAGTVKDGYGSIRSGKVMLQAHRLSYMIHNGPILEGHVVRHTCDNPPCCNPHHLVPGTVLDNIRDMVSRKRQALRERNAGVKLTEDQVAKIRRDYVYGSRTHGQPALARKYHVHHTQIGHIVRGENWT